MAESDIQMLVKYLEQTLSPDRTVGRAAESYLESIEANPNYAILLLKLIDQKDVQMVIRVAAAVTFKNFIKRNWVCDGEINKISESDRCAVKSTVIGLMLQSQDHIQRQLSDAISIIGREDFPGKWNTLLNEMVQHMQHSGGDFRIINGVLQTAHSLFKRYRHEFRSEELWAEIKYVLEIFAKPFTDLFVATVALSQEHANNAAALKIIFSSLVLCAKIFNSLNCQDLPEFFEDNLQIWMSNFLNLLSVRHKCLQTSDEDDVGLLEQLKSVICENITMYAQKYSEEFNSYLPAFVQAVWDLLSVLGLEPKYDMLVSTAMRFLSQCVSRYTNKNLFENSEVLNSLCSRVVIPNMQFRDSDEEMFQDNPEEYIRRDIEGSDMDTRRRAACDLVKSLAKIFESQITPIFGAYVIRMLDDYRTNPQRNWKSKDVAIYLVTALSVKSSTVRSGTTETSSLVDVISFYNQTIKEDLENQKLDELPVLKADALKFLMTFRNQLPLNEIILPALPFIIAHLSSTDIVIHTYAAHCLERLMTMREDDKKTPKLKFVHFQSYISILLPGLFNIFNIPGSSENEYVMRAIMRTFSMMQENLMPYYDTVLPKLTQKLIEVAKNPRKPHFNHYIFESLSICIRTGTKFRPDSIDSFETLLFPLFQQLMVQDVQEFMPYVFQILSLLMESRRPDVPMSNSYNELFPYLLAPLLWDRPANVKPLIRLLRDYLERGADQIVASGKLEPLLGVFQKLIASKSNDHEGFYLLQTILETLSREKLEQYMKQIFVLLFQRLTTSKTTKYIKCLLAFFAIFIHKYGCLVFSKIVNEIQPNMFHMVLERLFIPEVQKVSGNVERKMCAVGLTDIITSLAEIPQDSSISLLPKLLEALIALFELPEDETLPEDEYFPQIDDSPEYQASYAQLLFAQKKEADPFNGTIPDAKQYLAQKLSEVSSKKPGCWTPIITSMSPDAQSHLAAYITAAKVVVN